MAVFGDLGSVNAKSLSYLQEETQAGKYDAFLHVGKFFFNECEGHACSCTSTKFLIQYQILVPINVAFNISLYTQLYLLLFL